MAEQINSEEINYNHHNNEIQIIETNQDDYQPTDEQIIEYA